MQEQEFNYGEWYIDELGDVVTDLKDDSGGDIVCLQPEEWKESMKRWEKNRQLIISAPELLKALKKMCEFHENNASWDKGDNGYYQAKKLINKLNEL